MINPIEFNTIDGFTTGHAQDPDAGTGCSVVICPAGAVSGVDVRGGAPGTRETDLLDPVNLVELVHAVFLSGGSAFGLDASAGIMAYLEEHDIGFDVPVGKVPIVAGAVLFDLVVGKSHIRPDKNMGYQACVQARSNRVLQGCIGAGTGACVGKIAGMDRAMKSGLGCHAVEVGDLQIGAMVAVNCLGDVIDPSSGRPVAGVLTPDKQRIGSTEEIMVRNWNQHKNPFVSNTTIGVILTNATLTKSKAKKLASMAHNGFARTLRPAHSMFDGDTIFTMGSGKIEADLSVVGLLAAQVMEQAVLNAIRYADAAHGLPCSGDIVG